MTRTQYQWIVYLVHFLAVATTLILIVLLLPGFQLRTSLLGLAFVTAVFALLTTVIKPLLEQLISPLIILFSTTTAIVLNTLMLILTEILTDGILAIENLLWAVLGGAIVGMVSGLVNGIAENVRRRLFVEYRKQRKQDNRERLASIREQAMNDERFRR